MSKENSIGKDDFYNGWDIITYRNGSYQFSHITDYDNITKKTQEYQEKFANPFIAASRGYVDDIILPRQTRKKVGESFDLLKTKNLSNPWKKHGNIPL